MTTDDINSQLPNGFHDAVLRALRVEFANREVHFGFDFLIGMPEADTEEGREAMRPGTLRLLGVTSMHIEPPDPGYRFSVDDGIFVDGDFGTYPGEPARPDDGLVRFWLYISTWNSRMEFTAESCEFEWEGP